VSDLKAESLKRLVVAERVEVSRTKLYSRK